MQKTFIAIALALTLTCAFAGYTPTAGAYAKAPVSLNIDGNTNFTNMSSLFVASLTVGDVYLVSGNLTTNPNNASAANWNLWYLKLDAKSLTTGANNTASLVAPQGVSFYNNFAFGFGVDNDSSIPQLRVYQVPITAGTTGPARLQLSTNTNASYFPVPVGMSQIGKTVYVFYMAASQKVNITNFVVGSATVGTPEFTLTTAYDSGLTVAWGEALGSNQLFAAWIEGGVLKDSVLDVSKGTVGTVTSVGAYDKAYVCSAYATDKKQYGELCTSTNATAGTVNYFVRTTAATNLVPLNNGTLFTNTSTMTSFVPYGPYLAIFYRDTTATSGYNVAYDIWNLDNIAAFKNRTTYLNLDVNSTQTLFRVPAGGLYNLIYNIKIGNGTISGVQVGLLLGSSYLASVLGFLLTIVAGLFLF